MFGAKTLKSIYAGKVLSQENVHLYFKNISSNYPSCLSLITSAKNLLIFRSKQLIFTQILLNETKTYFAFFSGKHLTDVYQIYGLLSD